MIIPIFMTKNAVTETALEGQDGSATSTPRPSSADVYQGCYESKGCYGIPAHCVKSQDCQIISTYQKLSDSEFKFEIGYPSDQSSGYSALAFSNDDKMGNDSVMACVLNSSHVVVDMYWNTFNYNSVRLADPHFGIKNITGKYSNSFVHCTFVRNAVTDIKVPDSNITANFDLVNSQYFLFLATGSVNDKSVIQYHSNRNKTYGPEDLNSFEPKDNSKIYDGCGDKKGCFGSKEGCIQSNDCEIITTYQKVSDTEFQFEIGFPVTSADNHYSALAFSVDDKMGNDSVMACILNASNVEVNMYWNTPDKNSVVLADPHFGISNISSSYENGFVQCTFYRKSVTNITSPDNFTTEFDLVNRNYYLLLALGPTDSAGTIQYHTSKLSSTSTIDLTSYEPPNNSTMYNECSESFGCTGIPTGCVESQNCTVLMKWIGISEDQYQINLLGNVTDQKSYLAFGLSMDNMMGNDSVLACLGTTGDVQYYWNTANPFNSLPVSNISSNVSDSNVKIAEGFMNCSFTLNSQFQLNIPSTDNEQKFNLNAQEYYLLLARGFINSSNLIEHHDEKSVSTSAIDLSIHNKFIPEDIYSNCFKTKGCFGTPPNCIGKQSCDVVVTYKKISASSFNFAIGFPTTHQTDYAALAFSDDDAMGDDSAMACIMYQNGTFDVNMYWNTANPYNSLILSDPHLGLSQISGKFTSGFTQCEFTREATTIVKTPSNQTIKFDLIEKKYFLLLAKGPTATSTGIIQKHNVQDKSGSSVDLGSYDSVKSASKLWIKLHGFAMTFAWLLFANLGVFVACYFKGSFQVILLLKNSYKI